jgi:hypothetical protein
MKHGRGTGHVATGNGGFGSGRMNGALQSEDATMTAESVDVGTVPASLVLGRKLDTIPFSAYHVVIILVLGFVGFIEGYDLALTGSLLVLAKAPLHLGPDAVRALATWPTFLVVADSGDVACSFRDHVAGCSDMMSPA